MNENNTNNINKISVMEFVNKYNNLSSIDLKNKMASALVYRTYVPILEKKLIMQTMFDKSLVGETSNIYVDAFLHKINTTIAIIEMYTNITFKKSENSDTNIFDDYDMLAENNLLNVIFDLIPESELSSVLAINDQIAQTFYNEHKSTEAFITNIINRFSTTFGTFAGKGMESLSQTLEDNDKMQDIISKLPKPENIVNMFKEVF